MKPYPILISLALTFLACGCSPAGATDPAATQVAGEEVAETSLAGPTQRVKAPTAEPEPTSTPGPSFTSTPAWTATQRALPSSTATPATTPTPEVTQRSQDVMSMVYVPAGDFTMGNLLGVGSDEEAPRHVVTLDGYWIDRTEVTNAHYSAFAKATGRPAPALCNSVDLTYNAADKADHPVVCVNWNDAQAYCAWVGGRLPTEAEWEKAARGVDERTYPWGNSFDGSRTNYCDANCKLSHKDPQTNDGYTRTAPAGSYPAGVSPYGALDMAGNAWEWVGDWYNFFYYARSPQLNPQGPNMGEERVLRGGAWNGFATNLRSAFRAWLPPDQGDSAIGFRCVVSPIPAQ